MKVKAILHTLGLIICLAAGGSANQVTSCYRCYGINCQRTSLPQEQECADSLDYCVTISDDSAKVLYKGCSLEIPVKLQHYCDAPSRGSCSKCITDRCNNVGAAEFACIQCDSSKDSNCAEKAEDLRAETCATSTASNSYCYVKSLNAGSRIQRGCAVTLADQQSCLKDANCQLCSPRDIRGCNNFSLPKDLNAFDRFIRFLH